MKTFDETLNLVIEAHKGQTSKDGTPFIYHPIGVAYLAARLFPNEPRLQIISLLHDIIEDSDTTYEQLSALGYDSGIIQVLTGLTRLDGETYKDYIKRVSCILNATKVKICDLMYNINRASTLSDRKEEIGLRKRWQDALLLLRDTLLLNEHLELPNQDFINKEIERVLLENLGNIFKLELKQ